MKRLVTTILVVLFAIPVMSPVMAADVGVSISIGEPGYYGHVDIGNYYPEPTVVYAEPVIIEHHVHAGPPVYLHVPPSHYRHWDRHCHHYGACGRPVYFVQHDWYEQTYVPAYHEKHHKGGGKKHKHKHG